MERQRWRDSFEGIGLVAIIASLVFVGIETRNSTNQTELNTQALEIAAYQELISNISDINALTIEDRDAAELMASVYGFSNVEDWRLASGLYILFRHGDIAFFMYERDAIDENRLRSALRILPLSSRVGGDFWARRKIVFVRPYQEYIDRLIEDGFWTTSDGPSPLQAPGIETQSE